MNDPQIAFLIIGIALIAIELIILQASVFWLLLFGAGALIASLALWLMPELGWYTGWAIFFSSSLLLTLLLWKPIRRWQNKPSSMPGKDMIGQKAVVTKALIDHKKGRVSWSGAQWDAVIDDGCDSEEITVGSEVELVSAEGITLSVKL